MNVRIDQFDDFSKFTPDENHQLVSVGAICQIAQVMPRQLKIALDEAQSLKPIQFAQVVDGVGYFTMADAELLLEILQQAKAEVAKRTAAAGSN